MRRHVAVLLLADGGHVDDVDGRPRRDGRVREVRFTFVRDGLLPDGVRGGPAHRAEVMGPPGATAPCPDDRLPDLLPQPAEAVTTVNTVTPAEQASQ